MGVPEGEAPGRRNPAAPPSEGVDMGRYAKRAACGAATMTLASPAGAPRPSAGATAAAEPSERAGACAMGPKSTAVRGRSAASFAHRYGS